MCVRVCLFTRLVCVSGDSKPSEASPQSVSINNSSVGGLTAATPPPPPPPPTLSYSSMQRSKVTQNTTKRRTTQWKVAVVNKREPQIKKSGVKL